MIFLTFLTAFVFETFLFGSGQPNLTHFCLFVNLFLKPVYSFSCTFYYIFTRNFQFAKLLFSYFRRLLEKQLKCTLVQQHHHPCTNISGICPTVFLHLSQRWRWYLPDFQALGCMEGVNQLLVPILLATCINDPRTSSVDFLSFVFTLKMLWSQLPSRTSSLLLNPNHNNW